MELLGDEFNSEVLEEALGKAEPLFFQAAMDTSLKYRQILPTWLWQNIDLPRSISKPSLLDVIKFLLPTDDQNAKLEGYIWLHNDRELPFLIEPCGMGHFTIICDGVDRVGNYVGPVLSTTSIIACSLTPMAELYAEFNQLCAPQPLSECIVLNNKSLAEIIDEYLETFFLASIQTSLHHCFNLVLSPKISAFRNFKITHIELKVTDPVLPAFSLLVQTNLRNKYASWIPYDKFPSLQNITVLYLATEEHDHEA